MPGKTPLLCPICELRAAQTAFGRPRHLTWPSPRYMAQMQRSRPSRMTLSRDVPKSPPTKPTSNTSQRPRTGPFAGMNRTHPGLRVLAEQQQKAKTSQRTTKPLKPITTGSRDRGGKAERQPGEFKALKMQKSLSQVTYGERSAAKESIGDIESFDDFPLLPSVQEAIRIDALKGMSHISPTPIQRLAIPAILGVAKQKRRRRNEEGTPTATNSANKKQFLLAAETGSGKTLAYAIPTIDAIKRAEEAEAATDAKVEAVQIAKKKNNIFELDPPPTTDEPHPTSGRPRVIVLVPTAELVEQIGNIFKIFSHTVRLRVALISANYSATIIRNRLFGPSGIDVVVCTPHLLGSIAESDPNILSRVTHLIIDEADSLFDRSFAPLTSRIIDRSTPSMKQLILCSATIPRSLDNYLRRRFPEIERLATPNLHAIPRRVQLRVVDIDKDPYRGNRDLACADAIWSIGRDAEPGFDEVDEPIDHSKMKRILVFVNERTTANAVAEYLVTKGIDAAPMNRDTNDERQEEILASFTSQEPVTVSKNQTIVEAARESQRQQKLPGVRRRVLTNTKVLVMTDLGSRGIDTIAVRNVILYDVPHTTIDFIHRLGRTGRMGRRGKGLVLVGKGDRKDVVREVREGMYRGQPLI